MSTDALRAEWTKFRTVGAPVALLLLTVVVTVGVSAVLAAAARCGPGTGCPADPAEVGLGGVRVGQAVVAALAVLVVSGEYGSGLIRSTLVALPRRHTVLAAKATVVAGGVLIAGTVAVAGSVLAGRSLITAVPAGPLLRASAGSVLYLVLVALLSVGVAMAVRDGAAAAGTVLGLLYGLPLLAQLIAQLVADPDWQRRLAGWAPSTAGLAIQATTDLDRLPVAPWAGLGVLAAWAAAALVIGGVLLRWRDA